MRRVAKDTAFGFYNRMFVDEGTCILLVALDAHHIILRGGFRHAFLECAVRIMAVGALHQTFVNLVVEGLGEGWLHVFVAGIAERRLFLGKQERAIFRLVNTVAIDAAYFRLAMRRSIKALVVALVALQAMFFNCLWRGLGEAEYK